MDCRATFFLLGSMTRDAPRVAAEIAAAGHEIAVHGCEHRSTLWRTPRQLQTDIADAVEVISEATGRRPRLFRPPYGTLSAAGWYAAQQLDLRTVLWTACGRDWRADATGESIIADIERGVVDGGTVLLHDSDCTSTPGSWRSTLDALPVLVSELRSRGLEVGPLNDHWG
jgi:peptidoglycan/xylan/chitin deacetylase (PgdA/CDA1 family)